MSEPTFLLFAAFALLLAMGNERIGFLFTVISGFLQDPLRKVIPGEPVYLTVLVGAFVGATIAGMWLRGVRMPFGRIHKWNPVMRIPLVLFVLLVLGQSVAAYARTGSAVVAGIGLIAYLSPIPALLLGFHFFRTEGNIRVFARLYVCLAALMLIGVYLSALGIDWKLLDTVGSGLHAYAVSGGILDLHGGFFRGSELAGWHGATAACLVGILYITQGRSRQTAIVSAILIVFLLGAVLLTGRRKFLVEVAIFILAFSALTMFFQLRMRRLGALVAVFAVVAFGIQLYLASSGNAALFIDYYERGLLVQEEAGGRFAGVAIANLKYVYLQNGFFGSGAGTGSQGSQYFGAGASLVGSAAEGGPGKVLAELGVPGLVLLLWLLLSAGRYALSVIRYAVAKAPERATLATGLAAFLAANAMIFTISHQIFGDIFILFSLGLILSAVFAIPWLPIPAKSENFVAVQRSAAGRR